MKKIVLVTATMIVTLLLMCACTEKHYDESNISELYSKEWIIGKSQEEIEDKYGPFQESVSDDGNFRGAFYINYDNKGIDPSYVHDTYWVVFNQDHIAIDAYFIQNSAGG